MADITMCQNKKCKGRNKCYRYLAKSDEQWQSYFVSINSNNENDCRYFIPIDKKNKKEMEL